MNVLGVCALVAFLGLCALIAAFWLADEEDDR